MSSENHSNNLSSSTFPFPSSTKAKDQPIFQSPASQLQNQQKWETFQQYFTKNFGSSGWNSQLQEKEPNPYPVEQFKTYLDSIQYGYHSSLKHTETPKKKENSPLTYAEFIKQTEYSRCPPPFLDAINKSIDNGEGSLFSNKEDSKGQNFNMINIQNFNNIRDFYSISDYHSGQFRTFKPKVTPSKMSIDGDSVKLGSPSGPSEDLEDSPKPVRRKTTRALTGRHVRSGTGASQLTLNTLREKLKRKSQDPAGTPTTTRSGGRGRGRRKHLSMASIGN